MAMTPREPSEDENRPPPPKESIGRLPKGERPASLPRGKGELLKYVAAYGDWGRKEKNAGSEQFRYLVRNMHEVESMLKKGEKTLNDFKGEVRNWKISVAAENAVAVYETSGRRMQQRLKDLKGDTNPQHFEKVYAPDGGYLGEINTAVRMLQVWVEEEMKCTQAPKIIQDRLIFGATNLTPLPDLKGRFVAELSKAHALVKEWRRAFDREAESAKIEKAEKERRAAKAACTNQRTSPSAPSAPTEERCQAIKAWPGQPDVADAIPLTVDEIVFRIKDLGDGWSKVRRKSDDTTGMVPSKRLRLVPLPPPEMEPSEEPAASGGQPPPPAVSDDEEMDEAGREDEAAREEADAAFVASARADEQRAAEEEEANAAECGFGD